METLTRIVALANENGLLPILNLCAVLVGGVIGVALAIAVGKMKKGQHD